MANPHRPAAARPLSDIAGRLLDPVLQRRAGVTMALMAAWPEIAGADLAAFTAPHRIDWPQSQDGRAATLVVACEGHRAVFLAHVTGELIQRINGFFGFPAVGRVRIVQRPTQRGTSRPKPRRLTAEQEARVRELVAGAESEALKTAIERLARGVYGRLR